MYRQPKLCLYKTILEYLVGSTNAIANIYLFYLLMLDSLAYKQNIIFRMAKLSSSLHLTKSSKEPNMTPM